MGLGQYIAEALRKFVEDSLTRGAALDEEVGTQGGELQLGIAVWMGDTHEDVWLHRVECTRLIWAMPEPCLPEAVECLREVDESYRHQLALMQTPLDLQRGHSTVVEMRPQQRLQIET